MASCITEQWDGRSAPRLQLTVNIKSTSGNKVTLAWEVDYVAHDSYAASTGSPRSYSAVINGTKVVSGTYDINGIKGIRTIKSGTYEVTKSTSAKKISFSCSMAFNLTWSGNYAGTKSASGTIDIPKIDSYSITYNANGGTGAPNAQTKWYGTDITLSSAKPSRAGYTFDSWNTRKDGTAKTYNPGDKYTTDADLTLYAMWTPIKYTISFNANSNDTVENLPTGQQKSHGVNLTITNKTPTRTNYNFLGWGTSASATTVAYAPGSEYTKDAPLTLYAIWSSSYTKPRIKNSKAYRCTKSGLESDSGTYIKVTFDWETDLDVTALRYQYKLSTDADWTETLDHALPAEGESMRSGSVTDIVIGDPSNNLSFDVNKAYKIDILVADAGGYSYHIQTVNAVIYPLDILKGGKGIAFGKPAEYEKFDVAFNANFDKDVNVKGSLKSRGYSCFTTFDTIGIVNGGTGATNQEKAAKNLGYGKILSSRAAWMTSDHSITLPEPISEQPHGIVLVFSECVNNQAENKGWTQFFISKSFIAERAGEGFSFPLFTYNFDALGVKHLFIFGNKIVGSDENSQSGTVNGVTYNNTRFMLRYVLGV